MTDIPIDLIEDNPLRIAETNFTDIIDSFSQRGQLTPIRVRPIPSRPGRFQVIFGNRRLMAARKLHWEKIEAIITNVSDSEALLMALSENLDREDFTDYEKGFVIEQFHITTGKNYEEIARLIGRSPTFVSQHVAMLHLFPESIASKEERMRVLSKLSEKHARVLSKLDDPIERWNTSKLVISAGLGVREVQKIVSSRRERCSRRIRDAREEVEILIREMVTAINAKNLKPCFDLMAPQFTLFSPFPPYLRMDRESARKHIYEVVHEMEQFRQEIADLEISTFGNTAYASMYIHFLLGRAGKQIRTVARATVLLKKEEDHWTMLHEHWSPINTGDILSLSRQEKPIMQMA